MNWPRILSLLAHELRSPSSVITGYTRMIREGRLDAASRAQAVKQIERAAGVVSNIGRQASELSRWMSFDADGAAFAKAVPLPPIIANAVHRIETKSTINLHVDPAVEHACVRIFERDALAVALSHLIGAVCREALGQTIQVVVSPGPDAQSCDIVAAQESAGDVREIAKRDDAAPLFELGGWGLSLVVGSAVVAAHGGTVFTDTERPGAVRVRLRLETESTTRPVSEELP
jgi:signal transduction histidine kinase